jgi:hypothetical protein
MIADERVKFLLSIRCIKWSRIGRNERSLGTCWIEVSPPDFAGISGDSKDCWRCVIDIEESQYYTLLIMFSSLRRFSGMFATLTEFVIFDCKYNHGFDVARCGCTIPLIPFANQSHPLLNLNFIPFLVQLTSDWNVC